MSARLVRRDFLKTVASTGAVLVLSGDWLVAQPGAGGRRRPTDAVNYRYRTVSIENLARLRQDFTRILESGAPSDNEIFRSYIEGYEYAPPSDFPEAKSLIVVALEDWISEIDFRYNGIVHRVVIPPGYVRTGPGVESFKSLIATDVVGRSDARLEFAAVPHKLLAARSGLASYGRNNISFVTDFGSFYSLWVFYCDRTFENNSWTRVTMMPECRGCSICIDACPTKAISADRFVIDVNRCITLYNERPDPMPEWLDPKHHHTLVGCSRCQFTCPANSAVVRKRELLAEITEDETQMLVTQVEDAQLTESVKTKLARCGMVGDLQHLGRNLRLALEANGVTIG